MRLLPRSLFGRLVLVVLAVLVIAQLASLALHMHERGELLMQASGMRGAQRIGDIVKLFDSGYRVTGGWPHHGRAIDWIYGHIDRARIDSFRALGGG